MEEQVGGALAVSEAQIHPDLERVTQETDIFSNASLSRLNFCKISPSVPLQKPRWEPLMPIDPERTRPPYRKLGILYHHFPEITRTEKGFVLAFIACGVVLTLLATGGKAHAEL